MSCLRNATPRPQRLASTMAPKSGLRSFAPLALFAIAYALLFPDEVILVLAALLTWPLGVRVVLPFAKR